MNTTPKRISSQSITGEKGVNLVQRIVLQMGYIWRPTPVLDAGIDGEIEIRDPVTSEATNAFIKVQIKATTLSFQAETPDSFEYSCTDKDLDYWLRGNAPVILVVCRPDADEAYWSPVKDYFREVAVRKTRKVRFDKHRDRFDSTCQLQLKELALPKSSGIYFASLQKTEKLYSNLLKVRSFGPKLYLAETEYRTPGQLWAKFKSVGVRAGPEWMLANKRILSFHNLEESPFNAICDVGTCDSFDSSEWADSDDLDKRREFVRLLNLCLQEKPWRLDLRYDKNGEYYYFRPLPRLRTRLIEYQSIQRRVPREVFKRYGKKSDPAEIAYCRHCAFRGYFLRLDGAWYLEITPTYHFTSDGRNEDRFREERLSGIKRLERNPAVIGHLLMWADYLPKPRRDMFTEEYPFLCFGELMTADIDAGIPDELWYQAEEGIEAQTLKDRENQPGLWGL